MEILWRYYGDTMERTMEHAMECTMEILWKYYGSTMEILQSELQTTMGVDYGRTMEVHQGTLRQIDLYLEYSTISELQYYI